MKETIKEIRLLISEKLLYYIVFYVMPNGDMKTRFSSELVDYLADEISKRKVK